MIVCVVDDLIFSIKISTAAKHLGVDMYFERSKDKVLQTVREKQPSLVIFDLNSSKLAPIDDDRGDEGRAHALDDPNARLRVSRGFGHDRPRARRRDRSGPGSIGVLGEAWRDPDERLSATASSHHASAATTTSMPPAMRATRPMLVDCVCSEFLFLSGNTKRIEHGDRSTQRAGKRHRTLKPCVRIRRERLQHDLVELLRHLSGWTRSAPTHRDASVAASSASRRGSRRLNRCPIGRRAARRVPLPAIRSRSTGRRCRSCRNRSATRARTPEFSRGPWR